MSRCGYFLLSCLALYGPLNLQIFSSSDLICYLNVGTSYFCPSSHLHLHLFSIYPFFAAFWRSFSIQLFNSLIHASAVCTLFSFHFITFILNIIFFNISTWLVLILVPHCQNLLFFLLTFIGFILDCYGLM